MLTFRSSLVLIFALAGPAAALNLSGQARVTDGDSLVIAGERVRLHGIDAPERAQRCDPSGRNWACGVWATDVLTGIVGRGVLACEAVEMDRYGRTVARCTVSGRDVGALMVAAGAATAYAKYSHDYIGLEREAKAEARGLWSGAVTPPAEYRKVAKRAPAQQGCQIKGNINAKGVRIYHVPGQRDHAATRISTAKGEAYFCSEAQAQAAGFRAARR
jgi:endonuclease YncB( thermonuclease family)